jgi:hypothetical protein
MSRKIEVGGQKYEYRVGENFVVAKNLASGKGARIEITNLVNLTTAELATAKAKGSFEGVKPSHVAGWLQSVAQQQ